MHPAAIHQNRLNSFRNAMPANALTSVARHDADNQRTGNRHKHHHPAQMRVGRGTESAIDAMEIQKIGKQPDQPKQDPRDTRSDQANSYGENRNRYYARGGSELAEFFLFHTECPDIWGPFSKIASSVRASSGPEICTSRQCSEDSFSRISSPSVVSSTSTSRRSSSLVRRTTAPRSTSRLINSTVL